MNYAPPTVRGLMSGLDGACISASATAPASSSTRRPTPPRLPLPAADRSRAAKARSLSAVIPRALPRRRLRPLPGDRDRSARSSPPHAGSSTAIDENLDAGRGLWFMGPVGTGKTTLAMLVTKAALEAGRSAARYSLPGLLRQIRKTFDTGVARRPARAPDRRRPAAHRRHRRRADDAAGCWRSCTRSSTPATRSSARW